MFPLIYRNNSIGWMFGGWGAGCPDLETGSIGAV